MYKKIILLLAIIPFCIKAQNSAPVDYIVKSIKVDYGFHNFFKFNTNTLTDINQSGWDIAFYNEVHEIGGKINDAKGVRIWRVFKDTINFTSATLADTSTNIFFNNDSFAYLGAMDTIYTGSSSLFFNIGMGKFYTDPAYSAVATRFFIIKKSDGSFGKFYVSYTNRIFTIRYSNMDNTGDKYIHITKQSPSFKQYQYLDLNSSTISITFEPNMFDWDIVFRKYVKVNTELPLGIMTNNSYNLIRFSNIAGLPAEYLKYGIVSTECYEIIGDPATVTYNGSLSTMEPISRLNNQIADKWLNTTTQQPITNKSFFLRDRGGRLWHLIFTTYDAATNTIGIAYKDKGQVASIQSEISSQNYIIYQQNQNLIINFEKEDFKTKLIQIFDINGRKLVSKELKNEVEINVSEFQNSVILIQVIGDKSSQSFKYFVK